MTSKVQAKLNFPIKKNIGFYGKAETTPKKDYTNATCNTPKIKTSPVVKKLMVLSSSESSSDSDSDTENYKNEKTTKEILSTPRRVRKSSVSEDKAGLSPPKQKKTSPTITPSPTPSTRMSNLKIGSPRIKEKLSPKILFTDNNKKYQNAKQALHNSATDNLPGREKELAELELFLQKNLDDKTSSSLYISGPPGTGKTACLSKLMEIPKLKQSFKNVYINCTSIKSPGAIYGKILKELGIYAPKSNDKCKKKIEDHLKTNHKMILLVLDEIDQLLSKDLTVLYSIFEWPSIEKSKILLIGIANALDLTTNKLSRLQSSGQFKPQLEPKLMHFTSYNKQQIIDIITARLEEADVADIFTNVAIQMLAGKIAAISGDVRRALDISRRVIEIAESQKLNPVLKPAVDNAKNGGSPKKQQPDKLIDIKEVVAILNSVYGGMQTIEKDEDTFPLQQKLLLCSLMLIRNKGRNKDVTVGKLHEVYKKVCKKRNIHSLDESEFVGLCSLIETQGVLHVTGKKEPRLCKVNLQWDEDELRTALQDKKMMSDIIDDVSCL